MTAQCKVLHLLFSQSDYPKIVECHIIQSVSVYVCVCVWFTVCVITERLWRRLSETRKTTAMYIPLSFLQADQRSTGSWNDTVIKSYFEWFLFFFSPGQVAVKSLSTLHGNVIGFYAFLLKYVVRNHHLELFVFWISRHIRSAAHTVSISVRKHITMATVLHWQNIILIWDTHKKGRAIRTQGSLE